MSSLLNQWFVATFSFPDLPGALAIAARTALIYIFLIVGLRLLGLRELGQMSVYDLVLIIVIANSVQNAMVGQDTSLGGGLIAAATLLVLNRIFTWLVYRYPQLKRWTIGEPVLIIKEGNLLDSALRKEGVSREQVQAAMREHGVDKLSDVQLGVLEVDGTMSIVPKDANVHRTRRRLRGIRIP